MNNYKQKWEIANTVYKTKNYGQFIRLDDNRDLLSRRLSRLIESFTAKYIMSPIICNEKLEIIDGQGRYEAAKELDLPVYFIIVPGLTIEDCRLLNRYNSTWSALDYCKSFAMTIPAYALLLKTSAETSLPVTRVASLAGRAVNGGHKSMEILYTGKLQFTPEDAETVKRRCKMADELRTALLFSERLNDQFYGSIKVMDSFAGYNHERMLKNCKQLRTTFVQTSSLSTQLKEFERIYNYRSKNPLYFSDYMRNRGQNVRSYETQPSEYRDKNVSTLKQNGRATA